MPDLIIDGVPDPPVPLNKLAASIWLNRCEYLQSRNMLATTDREDLAKYCIETARYFKLNRFLEKNGEYKEIRDEEGNFLKYAVHPYVGQMYQALNASNTLGQRFGFDPASRTRIGTGAPKKAESRLAALAKK